MWQVMRWGWAWLVTEYKTGQIWLSAVMIDHRKIGAEEDREMPTSQPILPAANFNRVPLSSMPRILINQAIADDVWEIEILFNM